MPYGNYPDLASVKKILVIKLRHLGDVLLASPVFSILKKRLPNTQIDAYIYSDTYPMLEGHNAITNIHLFDPSWKKKFLQEIRMVRKIRKEKYDLVINLTEGDRGAILAITSGARYRIGYDRKLYTHRVKVPKTPRHTVEKHLDFLRCIGIFPTKEEKELFLDIPDQNLVSGDYILIHPVSLRKFKCYPSQKMADLIKRLQSQGKKIVLSSGPSSSDLSSIQDILSYIPDHHHIINLAGKTSLKELAALIKNASLMLCVDSVPLHIASVTKTPLIVLFGPSEEKVWGPWMHPNACVISEPFSCRPCHMDGCGGSKFSECLYSISVEKIMKAIDKLQSRL